MRKATNAVVLALILILTSGLLVAAIVQVQQAAVRMKCTNNLRQIGLALSSYHDAMELFPQAGLSNPNLSPEQRLSWQSSISPFYEGSNPYARVDRTKGWDAEENRFLAVMEFRVLGCPGIKDRLPVSPLISTPYVGITGLGPAAITLPLNDRNAGFFGYDRNISVPDLKRGESQVLAVLETAQVTGAWTAAGSPTARGVEGDGPYLGTDAPFGGCHLGGANALFADGSVRFLANTVDPEVIRAVARIADEVEVQEAGE